MILPRPHLLELVRDRERDPRLRGQVRLDRNEQVEPLPARVRREILDRLAPDIFNSYPDPSPLYERLSRRLGVPEADLLVTNGSDTAIRRVFETFVSPGETVVFADPTFPMYGVYARLHQARAEAIPYSAEREFPVDRALAALRRRPRLIAIVNPDNPTGATLEAETLRRIAAAAERAGTVCLVDEAYFPFFPQTAVSWYGQFENLVVTRTFSKIGGLAGLRLGYLVARKELVDHLQRTRGSHEVNSVAAAVGCYWLDHPELEAARRREIEAGRETLRRAVGGLGLETPPVAGNFQLVRIPGCRDTAPWVGRLRERGYLVKGGFAAAAVRDCLRVTLAGPPVMAAFADALGRVAEELAGQPAGR